LIGEKLRKVAHGVVAAGGGHSRDIGAERREPRTDRAARHQPGGIAALAVALTGSVTAALGNSPQNISCFLSQVTLIQQLKPAGLKLLPRGGSLNE
jgi:hypothetical protein